MNSLGFEACSRFVLRTPLVSYSYLQEWARDTKTSTAADDALDSAVAYDQLLLKSRLAAFFARPEVLESIFLVRGSTAGDGATSGTQP